MSVPPLVSHPIPDHPRVRERFRQARSRIAQLSALGAETARPSLSSDRINYLVSETPLYEIHNAPPEQPLEWIITRDAQAPVRYADPEQRIDGSGRWSGRGGTWTHDLIGFYTIEAQVGNWSAQTSFTVMDTFPRAPGKTAVHLIGIVHVAGDYRFAGPGTPFGNVPFIVEGAQQILNLGARRGCFYLTPQYKTSDYRFDDFGPSPIHSLAGLADSPPYRMLFEQPFDQFVLTTYTFANWEWVLDRAQGGYSVAFVSDVETAEIADLVAYLAETYPGKEFILKNWEGDWQLQNNYDIDGIATPERIQEFIEWMQARQAGVIQGRARAAADKIQHAMEFNLLIRSVRGEPGMLRDVVRSVESDLVSYSSWETSNEFDTRRMKDAIAFIRGLPVSRGREVLIGEFGHINNPADREADARLDALLRAFVDMGVKAYFWEIFNNGVPYGLIGPDFQRFYTWFSLREALGGSNAASIVHDPALTLVPALMHAGHNVSLKMTFMNTGPPWYQSVGYQLELLGPGGIDLGEKAWLPHDVPSSGQATFLFDFKAPAEPGTYQFQLAQRGIEVFGEPISFEVDSDTGRMPEIG